MPSLSLFDVGKRKAEGQRYEADIEAAIEAQDFLFNPIHASRKKILRSGQKPKPMKTVMLMGNHEHRIERATQIDPKWHGHVRMEDLQYGEYWDEVVPFLTPYVSDDIVFQHYFTDGLKDQSIGGVNSARRLTMVDGRTRIMGHSHTLQFYYVGRGRKRYGLVAGCYFDHLEDYLSPEAQQDWWRGIIILENCTPDGQSNPRFIPMSVIQSMYA
jgi:hypothetical protein